MIGMRVYIISIEVGGGSGSGPLLSFIESPKSLLLPLSLSLQWVNNGTAVAAGAVAERKNFRSS